MSKNLVIVESPTKADTIKKFLGEDFRILSSRGHIRDIDGVGKNSIGIDFHNNYCPNYVIDPQKRALISQLKTEVKKADKVWLATDEDREGEAIAWHLQEVLGLKEKDTKRIVFHEITKTAIEKAIQSPREIDYNLVNAQQARRVLDRIVGFEISPMLWKKIMTGLSAGRVQSVVVRLIVEREREIENFKSVAQYRVVAEFADETGSKQLRAELNHRFATKQEAMDFLNYCKDTEFYVSSVQKKPLHRSPAPPFTTSSLQQEAARKLHFPVSKTMRLAQALYEAGHITYMRTDSVNLSSLAINTAKTEILSEYGSKYHKVRQYHTVAKGAQEAHEAIRPTYMNVMQAGGSADEQRLYELIWKRTIACQMADAEVEQTRIEIAPTKTGSPYSDYVFAATGEIVVFDGFMRAYVQSTDDETTDTVKTIPSLSENEKMYRKTVIAQQSFSQPPYRYTEPSLVKKMEELGIGRPSTYATIVDTIQTRKYVERGNTVGYEREYNMITLSDDKITDTMHKEVVGADKGKLLPTDLGRMTNDLLVDSFPNILSYDFTAREEENFDAIAEGKADWVKTVDEFYKTFHPLIEKVPMGKMPGRELGTDAAGRKVMAKITKNGPCIQLGDTDEEKPQFASLKKGQSIYTITLSEALELFRSPYPYTLCQLEGEDIVVGEGKYGPYLRYNGEFVSIPKTLDPLAITEQQAIDLINKKKKAGEPIHVYGDIQVLNGRYGAYIKTADGNYRLPQGTDAQALTEDDCKRIINEGKPTERKRSFKRK